MECRGASWTVASKAGFLALQDAAKKRRDPSQTPGPWAGPIVVTTATSVYVTISLERWLKLKGMMLWIISEVCKQGKDIDFKTLELPWLSDLCSKDVPYYNPIFERNPSYTGLLEALVG